MARSVRITAYAADGSELLSIEPHGWDESKVDSIAGPLVWREADSSTPGYRDVEADITREGVRKLHEHFRHWPEGTIAFFEADLKRRAPDDRYRKDIEESLVHVRAHLTALDDLASDKMPSDARFVICIFEWESGLGD